MDVVVRELSGTRDLLPLAAAHPQRYPALLESVARGNARARHDVLLAFPGARLELHADGGVRDGEGRDHGRDFLAALDDAWRRERRPRDADDELPFHGGWFLLLGYELAATLESALRMPAPRVTGVPTALALRCPAAIVIDHVRQRTFLIAEHGHESVLDAMLADLEAAYRTDFPAPVANRIDEDDPAHFLEAVAHTHAHLRAGDLYQANLSREWRVQLAPETSAAEIYAALRRANPAPFAAFVQQPHWAIASSSPERLIEIRGDQAQTRPIAGTRPRTAGDEDAARIRELLGHPKERAEHVMLIDLERNDLGRICRPGSVVVDEFMGIESYAHVHHIVSNVRGTLRADVTPGEAIRATFPGGTITGCPKVRCMQIIAAREGVGRGMYTGSLGYLDRNGDLDLNILIRTMTIAAGEASFRAGAGIVLGSVAERELEETRAKARGLLRAFADPPAVRD